MNKDILTLPELAEYLRVTRKTIYRLAKSNRLPAFKIGGIWRFSKKDIDAWIGQQHKKED